jgi:hypothetical protein
MWLSVLKKTLWTIALVVVGIFAVASALFFLNQIYTSNQANAVRVVSFSVDPEGWKDPPDSRVACAFNITIENTGTNDIQGLWLKVSMFGFGENFVRHPKGCSILGVYGDLDGFQLSAGEIRAFQAEMHGGTTMESLHRSPVGATYLAQVVVGSSNVMAEAEWTDPFATVFVVAVIATGVTVIVTAIYFKKRRH